MLTEDQLLDAIHGLTLAYLKERMVAQDVLTAIMGLLEDNGRPFITAIDWSPSLVSR
jgi:hypothetical protein